MEKDERFIDEVWDKVKYMEYMEIENRRVKENEKAIMMGQLKASALLGVLSLISVIMVVFMRDMAVCMVLGVVMLALGFKVQGNIDGISKN